MKTEIKYLNEDELNEVNGGVAPIVILEAVLWGLGYIGAIDVAMDIGSGLGDGLYDALN